MARNDAGQVVLELKTPWRDGTTHRVMEPVELMQRLAARVPRPRLHLIRFHGVLAPNARWRKAVVPQAQDPARKERHGSGCGAHGPASGAPRTVGGSRLTWAELLRRVFAIDLERCPRCGGELKRQAVIMQASVVERILTHLGLAARAPPRAKARADEPQRSW